MSAHAVERVPLACLLAAFGGLVLPVALVRIPPLLDYPNHLARLWLLAGGVDREPLSAMYAVDWASASTNIGVDLLGATLGRLIGAEALGPLLIAAALVLPPLGAVLLNRAIFGGWHWWQVGFAILAWNTTLLAGFLSYQIGLGLALLAAAAERLFIRRTGPLVTIASRVSLGGMLLIFHLFAAAFYAVLLAGLVFGPRPWSFANKRLLGSALLRAATVASFTVAIPLCIFLLLAPTVPGGQAPPGVYNWAEGYTPANKIVALLSAISTYDLPIDVAIVMAVWTIAQLAASGPLLRIHAGLLTAGIGLLLLALLVPSALGGTTFVDWRFPIMAALTAVAAIRPDSRSPQVSAVACCCLLLLCLARTAWIAGIWQERQADVVAVEHALAQVPMGASVLPAQYIAVTGTIAPRGRYLLGQLPSYWHYPTLAVAERGAFVPTLFTTRGKQPLRVLPPWDSISVPEGLPAPVAYLTSFDPTPRNLYSFGYVSGWRGRFEYVLAVNADLPGVSDQLLRSELELVADEGFARLYRIRPANHAAADRDVETGNRTPSH